MKKILASLLIIVTAAFGIVNFSAPAVAAPIDCNPTSVLGINRWCNGLDDNFKTDGGLQKFVVSLAINILDMLLGIANYVAVIMVMYGGFLYLTAGSNEQQVGKGKKVITNAAIIWAGILAILMIIWGAIQYSTSAGDPGKIQKAKKTIINSVIGVVIVILAASIVNLVINQTKGL